MITTISNCLLLLITVVVGLLPSQTVLGEPLKVIYAINAGGDDHTDRHGIHYNKDPLQVGIASDYGKHLLMIGRVDLEDEVLYRTERYHTATFGYELPIDGDGDYILIMKFCEVYFDAPNRKVFDVLLNRKHTVVRQLDIYNQVGRGSAHDENIFFKISNNRLHHNGEISEITNGRIRLDFIKGALDNPKINAFALLKGDGSKLPRLPSIDGGDGGGGDFDDLDDQSATPTTQQQQQQHHHQQQQQHPERVVRYNNDKNSNIDNDEDEVDIENGDEHDDDDVEDDHGVDMDNLLVEKTAQRGGGGGGKIVKSGPKQPNPYAMDDSSIMLPVIIAIGAFIPLLFCLCKL